MYRTVNSRHVFTQLKSKVEVDSGSAKVLRLGQWKLNRL